MLKGRTFVLKLLFLESYKVDYKFNCYHIPLLAANSLITYLVSSIYFKQICQKILAANMFKLLSKLLPFKVKEYLFDDCGAFSFFIILKITQIFLF